jgi:hypothetical protein
MLSQNLITKPAASSPAVVDTSWLSLRNHTTTTREDKHEQLRGTQGSGPALGFIETPED